MLIVRWHVSSIPLPRTEFWLKWTCRLLRPLLAVLGFPFNSGSESIAEAETQVTAPQWKYHKLKMSLVTQEQWKSFPIYLQQFDLIKLFYLLLSTMFSCLSFWHGVCCLTSWQGHPCKTNFNLHRILSGKIKNKKTQR